MGLIREAEAENPNNDPKSCAGVDRNNSVPAICRDERRDEPTEPEEGGSNTRAGAADRSREGLWREGEHDGIF